LTAALIHYLWLTHTGGNVRTVYLCGGINGLSDAECKDWRAEATAALAPTFRVLDPMRRDYRGREVENVAAIVRGDLADIAAADVVLVNAARPSWGTAMELVYARLIGLGEIVAFNVPANPSPWLEYHCHWQFVTLAAALEYLKQ
jgi:nucleoside 2-deoxyribosyltransferase